jgi:membrane protease YdiL (CAAX protease family)
MTSATMSNRHRRAAVRMGFRELARGTRLASRGDSMRALFFDREQRLRNGWWILLFAVAFVLCRQLFLLVRNLLPGPAREPLPFVLVLAVTWICTRLRREPLASVGLQLDRRWWRQAAAGTGIGAAQMLLVVGAIAASGGVALELNPARSLAALLHGFYVFVFVALFEELLLRGFVFQRMIAGTGVWFAQLFMAALFAAGHLGNPGMEGATLVWAMLNLGIAALLFGLAYLRTGSLALPIGMHLGWNWMQGHVLGFGVSGVEQVGWWRPSFGALPDWLTGGAFGPESSLFAASFDLLAILILWRWKGVPTLISVRSVADPAP